MNKHRRMRRFSRYEDPLLKINGIASFLTFKYLAKMKKTTTYYHLFLKFDSLNYCCIRRGQRRLQDRFNIIR